MGTLFLSKGETTTPPQHRTTITRPACRLDVSTLTSLPLTIATQLTPGMLSRFRVLMNSAALDDLALILNEAP